MLNNFDIHSIRDLDGALECIRRLFNFIETLQQENLELKRQNQQLRDELNRLKGEQGKPDIKPPKKSTSDYSSEKERKEPQQWKKASKIEHLKVHEKKVCKVDTTPLPKDAMFKGYEPVVVQDIVFRAHNIQFLKEKYYSPSLNKTYLADLPAGYSGEFGPQLKAFAIKQYFDSNMTQRNILGLFMNADVKISAGQLSNLLIKDQDVFHQEKDALYQAGLNSSPWQHIDDTSTRVNGQNHYCQILCNPLYTAYFTTKHKSRLTVLDVLRNFGPRTFLLNQEAFGYLEMFKLSAPVVSQLQCFPQGQPLDQDRFSNLLKQYLPGLGPQQLTHVLDATAVAAYHAQMEFPVVRLLICDEAPQFRLITQQLSLCWVHDGRHYKKLKPFIIHHQDLLDTFLHNYWDFYRELLHYREHPSDTQHIRLNNYFDQLFSSVTGYDALDDRIAKTKAKKTSLLIVPDHPEIPLHNNPAELAARKRVRKRVVCFGTRTLDGTKAWDTFMSLAATAKKLGVNFYNYIYDRLSGTNKLLSLADMISSKSVELNLGASWELSP